MRASALIPRLYRVQFGRDMISDMRQLIKSYNKAVKAWGKDVTEEQRQDAQLSMMDLTIFENVAYMMIKHAGEDVPPTPDEWLDSIDGIFSIYNVMPTILELWGENQKTTSIPKKKKEPQQGNLLVQLLCCAVQN